MTQSNDDSTQKIGHRLYPEPMTDDIYIDPNKIRTFWKTKTVGDSDNENSKNSN